MSSIEPTTVDLAQIEHYAIAARDSGCPIDQLENFIRAGIVLQPKQLEASAVARLCDEPDGPTMLGFGGARGGGKATTLNCLVATPNGWSEIGLLKEGDFVIAADGTPTQVIKVHEVIQDPDAYEVVFDTGERIKCNAEHLWVTSTKVERWAQRRLTEEFRAARRAKRPSRAKENPVNPGSQANVTLQNQARQYDYKQPSRGSVRSTEEIRLTLHHGKEKNHSVDVAAPLDLPERGLPIDPYLLGLWLGDGFSGTGALGMLEEDMDIVLKGFEIKTKRTHTKYTKPFSHATIVGFKEALKENGLLKNKHIPDVYLRSSIDQRLELLRGLMDTDGYCALDGQCSICMSRRALVEQIYELVSSLGIKASLKEKQARCNGKPAGPTWTIFFMSSFPVFKLPRKLERQKTEGLTVRNTRRFIVDVVKVPPEPMRCITVAHPSGTFLIGKSMIPTHNSFWAIAQCAADDCQRYPGLKVLILRRVGKSNEQNFDALRKAALHSLPHSFAAGKGLLLFPNGSEIQLGHFQRETDIDAYLGLEYDVIVVEEATTLSAAKIENIRTCNRTSKPGWRPRMYLTTNPGGESTQYFKDTFVIPWRNKRERTTRYIPATVDDNMLVNREYTDVLDALTGWQYEAWRLGDWDAAAGQFFTTFRDVDHVIPYEKLPVNFEAWGVLDYGFTHYTSFGLFRKDGDGNTILQREYGARKTLPEQHAAAILQLLEDEGLTLSSLRTFIAGDDVWRTQRGGRTVAQDYEEFGIFFRKGNTDRVDGAAAILKALGNLYPQEGQILVEPTLQIMDCCKRTIEQLPAMVHDPARPEDVLKVDCDEKGRGGDDFYDMCVSLETCVLTRRGDIPICEITAGDEVMTRKGWKTVKKSWTTRRDAKVVKVITESPEHLECTPDHPVYVKAKGWVRADMLRYGDILVGWQNPRQLSSTELYSGDTRRPRKHVTETTISRVVSTSKKGSRRSTSRSGSQSMGMSLQVSTSTISTATAPTTASKTFTACRLKSTSNSIEPSCPQGPNKHGRKARTSLSWTKHETGTGPRKERSGIGSSTSPRSASRQHGTRGNASSVGPNMKAPRGRDFAPTPANPLIEEAKAQTKWSLSARRVTSPLGQTNTTGLRFVPVRVLDVLDEGKAMDVWNLEVEDCHEFFASGMLVHNCRYGVMEGRRRKTLVVTTDASTYEDPNAPVGVARQPEQPKVQQGMFVFRRPGR